MESKKILNLESVLPSSNSQCLAAARWVYKQPDITRFKVQELAQTEYFKLKPIYPGTSSRVLADTAFLIAAFIFRRAYKDGIVVDDAIQLRDIDNMKVEGAEKTRKSPQMDWLDGHYSDVMRMVKKGMSLREMEQFFLTERRHKVSHTIISNYIKMKGLKNE